MHRRRCLPTSRFRRLTLPLVLPLFCAFAVLCGGCGQSAPSMRVDDAVEATEDALTTLLLGASDDATSLATRDRPLLVKGVHDTVYITADAEGFHRLSRGAFTLKSVGEIEDRVARTVNNNVKKRGFTAVTATYPATLSPDQQPRALTATLLPAIQDSGSPQDLAQGKGKRLVLIRLIVADAATGTVLSERDYYSGNDVRRPDGTEHFRPYR